MEQTKNTQDVWVKADKSLSLYPLGTKAKSYFGGYWIKVKKGWKWHIGVICPTVGRHWNGYVSNNKCKTPQTLIAITDSQAGVISMEIDELLSDILPPQTLIATRLPGLILIEKIQGEGAE